MRYVLWLALLLSALVACSSQTTPVPTDALVLANGMVIDGTGADPIPNGIVVIQGKHIVAVGRADKFSIPSGANVIDAKGGTIMPGIINSHVHHTYSPETRRIFLVEGVTAVCDLGGPLWTIPQFEHDRATQGPAARGFRAGPIVTAPGGLPGPIFGFDWNYEVATPDEARAAVVDLLNRGTDVIKIILEPGWDPQAPFPVLSSQEVHTIVKEAHNQGVLVRVHVSQAPLLDIVLEAGVDVVEHTPVSPLSGAEFQSLLDGDDRLTLSPEYQTQLTRLIAQNVVIVPTLRAITESTCGISSLTPEQKDVCIDFYLEPVRQFHVLGGVVALGNDYPNSGVELGMPMPEMELLLAAGLTPMEVIEAGTRHAAYVCGHGDELGTLEPGKLADVIVVDGDPLVDIQAMDRVVVVVKDGELAFTAE